MPKFIKTTAWLQSAFDDTMKIHLENVEMASQEECSEVLEQNFKKFQKEVHKWVDCFKISPQHYAQMSIIAPHKIGMYDEFADNLYAPFVEYGAPAAPQELQGTVIDSTACVIDENVKSLPAPSAVQEKGSE